MRRGAYVVTGGLGGIGVAVVRQLLDEPDEEGVGEADGSGNGEPGLEETDATRCNGSGAAAGGAGKGVTAGWGLCRALLVVGRATEAEAGERLRAARWSHDARVVYLRHDLGTDSPRQLTRAIGAFLAAARQPLAGMLHLAGSYSRQNVDSLTARSLADHTRAKAEGAVHLHRAARALGQTPAFLYFGSLATVYAGAGLGPYAAANDFLFWFAGEQRCECGLDARIVEWTSWEGVGISRRDEALGMASWLMPLPLNQAAPLLSALLRLSPTHPSLLVGMRPRARDVGCLFLDGPVPLRSPVVFYLPDQCPPRAACAGRVPICIPRLPTTAEGRVDVHALASRPLRQLTGRRGAGGDGGNGGDGDGGLGGAELSSPSDVCPVILSAVSEVCGVSLDPADSLFDAGLSSLTSARLRAALQRSLGIEIPPRMLLELPDVGALSAALFHIIRAEGGGAGGGSGAAGGNTEVSQDSSLLVVRAAALVREGQQEEAERLLARAALATGVPLDAPGLRALLAQLPPLAASPGPETVRRMAPLLKVLCAARIRGGEEDDVAAAGYELLLRARGTAHSDAPILALTLALCHRRRGDAASAAIAVAASHAEPHACSAQGDVRARAARAAEAPAVVALRLAEVAPLRRGPKLRSSLITLDLSGLSLASVPPPVFHLPALQRLGLARNQLPHLPEEIGKLRALRELDLSSNLLASLPNALAELPQLFLLSLQGNRMPRLPPVAMRCRRLQELKWGAQRVGVGGQPCLRTEPAAAQTATAPQLPDAMPLEDPPAAALGNALAAAGAAITAGGEAVAERPEQTQSSTQLVTFEMEANAAADFPLLCPTNPYLRCVLASFNLLPAVPPSLLRHHGAGLRRLHLGCNRIASVDEALPHLPQLTDLMLEGNLLRSLPPSIGGLVRLRELWLHGNSLSSLPDEISSCASLTVLQAHHNALTDLPDAMRCLSRLQGLYLQSNRLTNLASLRARVLDSIPLQNLALGLNHFDLSEAFELPNARVGFGWNFGTPPASLPALTDRFATADHLFEPCAARATGDVLMVAFSAQGPGVQQWHAPAAALRASGLRLDALYVADPSNSFFLQDPAAGWAGLEHFDTLVRRYASLYAGRVLVIGSSMGATAALQHAALGARTLAFAPRVDLDVSHGAFVPADARRRCREAIARAVGIAAAAGGVGGGMGGGAAASECSTAGGRARQVCQPPVELRLPPPLRDTSDAVVTVHVGASNHVDLVQVACVSHLPGLHVVEHATFHHNVPQFLEQHGQLVPLLRDEILRVIRPAVAGWLER
jgi:leucine-rich repeat protein SHOC2